MIGTWRELYIGWRVRIGSDALKIGDNEGIWIDGWGEIKTSVGGEVTVGLDDVGEGGSGAVESIDRCHRRGWVWAYWWRAASYGGCWLRRQCQQSRTGRVLRTFVGCGARAGRCILCGGLRDKIPCIQRWKRDGAAWCRMRRKISVSEKVFVESGFRERRFRESRFRESGLGESGPEEESVTLLYQHPGAHRN